MTKILLVCVVVLAVTAAPAVAGRISASPYVFAKATPRVAERSVRAQIRKRFGSSMKVAVRCRGMYPGRHGGVTGFHEIHCALTAVEFDTIGYRGTIVYWLDRRERTRDSQHLVQFSP